MMAKTMHCLDLVVTALGMCLPVLRATLNPNFEYIKSGSPPNGQIIFYCSIDVTTFINLRFAKLSPSGAPTKYTPFAPATKIQRVLDFSSPSSPSYNGKHFCQAATDTFNPGTYGDSPQSYTFKVPYPPDFTFTVIHRHKVFLNCSRGAGSPSPDILRFTKDGKSIYDSGTNPKWDKMSILRKISHNGEYRCQALFIKDRSTQSYTFYDPSSSTDKLVIQVPDSPTYYRDFIPGKQMAFTCIRALAGSGANATHIRVVKDNVEFGQWSSLTTVNQSVEWTVTSNGVYSCEAAVFPEQSGGYLDTSFSGGQHFKIPNEPIFSFVRLSPTNCDRPLDLTCARGVGVGPTVLNMRFTLDNNPLVLPGSVDSQGWIKTTSPGEMNITRTIDKLNETNSGVYRCEACAWKAYCLHQWSTSIKSFKIDCPETIDGNWGTWSVWSDCSVTCGQGSRSRSRVCDSPAPQHGGSACPGDDTDTQDCDEGQCPSPAILTTTLTISPTGSIPKGSQVTFTCIASTAGVANTGNYQYKFLFQKPEQSNHTLLQDFSTNNTYQIDNFQIGEIGAYRCIARDVGDGSTSNASGDIYPVLDQCSPDPCLNHGVCVSKVLGIFFCECQPGFQGRWCQKTLDPVIPKPDTRPADDPFYADRTLTYLESFAVTAIPVSTFGVIIFLCCDGMAWFSRWMIKKRDPREFERMMEQRKRKPYLDITKKFLNVVNSTVKPTVAASAIQSALPQIPTPAITSKPSFNVKSSAPMVKSPVAFSTEGDLSLGGESSTRRRRRMIIGTPIDPATAVNLKSELTVKMGDGHKETDEREIITSHVGTSILKKFSTICESGTTEKQAMIKAFSMTCNDQERRTSSHIPNTQRNTVTKKDDLSKNKARNVSYQPNIHKNADSTDEEDNRILSIYEICDALLYDIPDCSIMDTHESNIPSDIQM